VVNKHFERCLGIFRVHGWIPFGSYSVNPSFFGSISEIQIIHWRFIKMHRNGLEMTDGQDL
jgi:hypothetical protein